MQKLYSVTILPQQKQNDDKNFNWTIKTYYKCSRLLKLSSVFRPPVLFSANCNVWMRVVSKERQRFDLRAKICGIYQTGL